MSEWWFCELMLLNIIIESQSQFKKPFLIISELMQLVKDESLVPMYQLLNLRSCRGKGMKEGQN